MNSTREQSDISKCEQEQWHSRRSSLAGPKFRAVLIPSGAVSSKMRQVVGVPDGI